MALIQLNNQSLTSVTALPAGVGGNVLQVVHAGDFAEQSHAISANTPVATNMTATITPTVATSKILITYTICTAGNTSGASLGSMHMVYHDIGQTGTDTAMSSKFFGGRTAGGNSNYEMISTVGHIQHDHNTTSAIDYTVYVSNTSAFTLMVNRGGSNSNINGADGYGSITLMEIAG
jgi:hypothetical protein